MKQNDPLHEEIWPHETEETLKYKRKFHYSSSSFLLFFICQLSYDKMEYPEQVRWGSIPSKHNSDIHHKVFGDTECKDPDSASKNSVKTTFFFHCRCPKRTKKQGNAGFPQLCKDIWRSEVRFVLFFNYYLFIFFYYWRYSIYFSVSHGKFLASAHYRRH